MVEKFKKLLYRATGQFFFSISIHLFSPFSFQFDRFRRKVIQYTFSTGPSFPDRELDDDEIADHLKQLAHEKVSLVNEMKQYAEAESEVWG